MSVSTSYEWHQTPVIQVYHPYAAYHLRKLHMLRTAFRACKGYHHPDLARPKQE